MALVNESSRPAASANTSSLSLGPRELAGAFCALVKEPARSVRHSDQYLGPIWQPYECSGWIHRRCKVSVQGASLGFSTCPFRGPTEIPMQGYHQPEQEGMNIDESGSGVPVLLCGRERAEAKDSPDFADVKLLSPVCSSGSFFEAFCITPTICQVQSCRQPTHTSPMAESTPAMHQQGLKRSQVLQGCAL